MDLQPRAPPKKPFVWTGLCAVDGPEHASPSDLAARNDDDPQHLYDTGIEIEFDEGDEKAAMVYYKRAAAAGHAGGLSKVGRARLLGVGGEALDVDEGVKLIRRAAELGNAMSQCNMASCYLQRKLGKEKSDKELFEEAVHWYRKAVGKGEWLAEWNLGVLVMDGMGTPRDEVAGLALIRSASEQVPT
jgi:TPR repeat protein